MVDDASSDDSADVAARFGCRVIRLPKNRGPAAARNVGARTARGDILYFIDADVSVAFDSLQRVVDHFDQDPELDALIGSYDDEPEHPDFLSQYKNLFHHYVHQTGQPKATTFWSGCGAIRRDVFLEYSGFSENYRRPAVEDIELGYRLHAGGRKIVLDQQLKVKHLKAWTFWRLMKSDILCRGIPWTELILRDARMPDDLNLQFSQRVSVVLVYLLILSVTALAIHFQGVFLVPLLFFCLLFISNYWFLKWKSSAHRRRQLVWIGISITAAVFVAYQQHMLTLIAPLLAAMATIFLQHRYLLHRGSHQAKRTYSILAGLITAGAGLYILSYLPRHLLVILPNLLLLTILLVNSQFYVFLTRRRNLFFMLAAVPFHLLYHFYNGLSFSIGTALHWWNVNARKDVGPSQPADYDR